MATGGAVAVVEDEARSIFLKALSFDPDRWDAVVGEACAANAELRARVDELLRAHRELGEVDGQRARPHQPTSAPVIEGPGSMIGPYRLLEQIGEGGFGIVYM